MFMMKLQPSRAVPWSVLACGLAVLAGCATPAGDTDHPAIQIQADPVAVLNRVTWGVNASTLRQADAAGLASYLEHQLHPAVAPLPMPIQAQIAAMTISQRPLDQLVFDL